VVRVLFTGVVDKEMEDDIRRLGGEIVPDIAQCTHVFAEQVKRTLKVFQAINRGLPIIGRRWVKDSLQRSQFLGNLFSC
jgi:hypothetical protein